MNAIRLILTQIPLYAEYGFSGYFTLGLDTVWIILDLDICGFLDDDDC